MFIKSGLFLVYRFAFPSFWTFLNRQEGDVLGHGGRWPLSITVAAQPAPSTYDPFKFKPIFPRKLYFKFGTLKFFKEHHDKRGPSKFKKKLLAPSERSNKSYAASFITSPPPLANILKKVLHKSGITVVSCALNVHSNCLRVPELMRNHTRAFPPNMIGWKIVGEERDSGTDTESALESRLTCKCLSLK